MPDTFLYFAYGSNMLTKRLRAKDRAPSARAEGCCLVEKLPNLLHGIATVPYVREAILRTHLAPL